MGYRFQITYKIDDEELIEDCPGVKEWNKRMIDLYQDGNHFKSIWVYVYNENGFMRRNLYIRGVGEWNLFGKRR